MYLAAPEAWPEGVEVLAVDLDVRDASSSYASAAVASAITRLGTRCRLFLKIDSTLRGPVGALIDGALGASQCTVAMVAPAFPEQGRHIRDGRLILDGQPGANLMDLVNTERCVVVDADGDAALRKVAVDAQAHPEWLLVGSAGLARQVAPTHRAMVPTTSGQGPILVVAGSPTAVTRQQLVHVTDLADVFVLGTPATDTRDAGEAAAELAERVWDWAERDEQPRAVVLTGGATARHVATRLGATSLRLHGEIQPGIPVGHFADGRWQGMTVVTKAGGFGSPHALLDVVRALGPSSPSQLT